MTFNKPVRSTANPSPLRRPGSIRRTTSIDVTWSAGMVGPRDLDGRCRDVVKLADGSDRVRAEAQMQASITFDRTITAMAAQPSPAGIERLVGEKGGGHLRGALRDLLPDLIAEAHPLYLVLDDISGTSLVSNWGWSQWGDNWLERMHDTGTAAAVQEMLGERTNVCWGFQPGFSSHDPATRLSGDPAADAKDLRNPADPEGWHGFPESTGVAFRRARRIDVWRKADRVAIEASFQDSAARKEGGRAALHEYILRVDVDPETMVLRSVEPEPRVLPFRECPGAMANARALAGTPLAEIRQSVLENLRGPAGCTHLNDALRALAEAPQLLAFLDEALVAA